MLLKRLHAAVADRPAQLDFLAQTYYGYRPSPTLRGQVTDENLPTLVRRDYQNWVMYCQGCQVRAREGELRLAVCPRCWQPYVRSERDNDY